MTPASTGPWRPSPLVAASIAGHGLAVLLLLWHLEWWPWIAGLVVGDHLVLCAAGLWPRSTWLGPNLRRLPAAAAERREVAITIDDGPDPEITPQVLAILAAGGAAASFFVIGRHAAAEPALCRAMVAAGHEVHNHGQTHRKRYSVLGPASWRQEVATAQDTIGRITGRSPRYFRAMAGLRNPFLDPVLHRLGLQLASWTRRGYDTRESDAERVLARLLRNLAAGDILLLHDGHAARTPAGQAVILAVLPRLLAELRARHLVAVTLGQACDPT